ncbi:MAG: hypothetical protein L0Y42_14670 [Phycisphaerales bacterium]|nr:hypothetical protein [Phycisphaerales bacterium]
MPKALEIFLAQSAAFAVIVVAVLVTGTVSDLVGQMVLIEFGLWQAPASMVVLGLATLVWVMSGWRQAIRRRLELPPSS